MTTLQAAQSDIVANQKLGKCSRTCTLPKPGRGACRFCSSTRLHNVVDLGMSPLCENYLTREQLNEMEPFYPLRATVCEDCFLVQVDEHVGGREIFCGEYAYFSSY